MWENGGKGGVELAEKVLKTLETKESHFKPLYADDLSLEEKSRRLQRNTMGLDGVTYASAAAKELKRIADMGMSDFPVCMAKNTVFPV